MTRLAVVVPRFEADAPDSRALAVLAERMSQDLVGHGVQVAVHLRGQDPQRTGPADVALWLAAADGQLTAPDPREVPARLHAGVLGTSQPSPRSLEGYDAVLVPHEVLVEPVRLEAERCPGRPPEVVAVRLPVRTGGSREAAKAARKLTDRAVVVLDVRESFERDIERVVFQLALHHQPAEVVLLVPHTDRARTRVRSLCERHEVDAWLASGPDALPGSLGTTDLIVGRLSWAELLLAAGDGCDVVWLEGEEETPGPLIVALREGRSLTEMQGVLQLAAVLDRRLADPGRLATGGTLLREQLTGEGPALLEVLGSLRDPLPLPRGTAAWERVGPRARDKAPERAHVEARQPGDAASQASRIEEALSALKARVKAEGGP